MMPVYKITEDVSYSGTETVTYQIEADSKAEAEKISEDYDIEDIMGFWNVDISTDNISVEEITEPRCKLTADMFS